MKTPISSSSRRLRSWVSRASLLSTLGLSTFVLLACSGVPEVTVDDGDDDGDDDDGGTGGSGTGGTILSVGGDDGGTDPEPEPEKSVCGNGELEPGELCDDGNKRDGDGCSGNCKEQDPEFDCSRPGEPCVDLVVCGNERLEGDEACDDGNLNPNDGCTASCTVTNGWVCPRPGEPCVELPVCGNGVRERGEACDDGGTASGDGCTGTENGAAGCQLETGFFCPVPGNACVELRCGDGNRTPDEECDDGDDPPMSGDGCSNTCRLEVGWRCNTNGCSPICGDGRVLGTEECDDGGRVGGDGCSAGCKEEPFYDCTGQPSTCVSSIQCGNGTIEPGEICDPPGTAGCLAGCRSFAPDTGPASVCGNSVIEPGESCDAPNVGSGCSVGCVVETGWTCPAPNQCFRLPTCGDGIVQGTEECDVGSMSSPGCVGCQVQDDWLCTGAQPSVCEQPICGDGVRSPNEECDDDNATPDDGCTSCVVDEGWVCPTVGEPCIPRCGDGVLTGDEGCDDGNRDNGDGCNAACRVEPGFACPDAGEECVEAVCGNGQTEPGEGCDDANQVAGDGCGPTCQLEPIVTVGPSPVVQVRCGDGVKTGSEGCDDGNATPGDGCSATCQIEPGFECTERLELPSSVQFRVRVRDFKSSVASGGHPDFQYGFMDHVPNIPGTVCTTANSSGCGRLDSAGKPALQVLNQSTTGIMNAQTFGLWYRDSNPTNVAGLHGTISMLPPFNKTLTLAQIGGPTSEVYQFDATANFFPLLDNEGFGPIRTDAGTCCSTGGVCNDGVRCTGDCAWRQEAVNQQCDGDCSGPDCQDRNYNFTTELRYFFQYKGGETLSFRGDDDVWVFINGRLAVDIGGLHQARHGRVVLGDDGVPSGGDSDCSAHATENQPAACALTSAEATNDRDDRFDLEVGNVYEIVLFHAERHTQGSNFQLTLSGFIAPRSFCSPDCGDGEVVGYEVCDDGDDNSNTTYGACNTTCTGRTFCGDGVRQGPSDTPSGPETCDNGRNLDTRSTGAPNQCAPGCQAPTRCGDGVVQAAFEQCDRGGLNDDDGYGPTSCTTNCAIGGYCGDGTRNGPETCDYAAPGSTTYGPNSCGYNCQAGPRCGDGVRNGPEECDGTMNCNSDCTLAPYCGDGVVSAGESCDYAQFASNDYGGCTSACEWGPLCGDESVDAPYEECDEGIGGNDGSYDGCTSSCSFGPRCGDGVLQSSEGEACDNGYNDDTYAYDDDSCAAGCSLPPSCGDGVVQSGFELCDEGQNNSDTAYQGCTTSCEWGPYCGDGTRNGPEVCDAGPNNVAYSAAPGACGYDCKNAPYCGDGTRNGPEQCDDGQNTGAYGGCKPDCKLAPYCGDGVVQGGNGEQCDDGPTGSLTCSVTCRKRGVVR